MSSAKLNPIPGVLLWVVITTVCGVVASSREDSFLFWVCTGGAGAVTFIKLLLALPPDDYERPKPEPAQLSVPVTADSLYEFPTTKGKSKYHGGTDGPPPVELPIKELAQVPPGWIQRG